MLSPQSNTARPNPELDEHLTAFCQAGDHRTRVDAWLALVEWTRSAPEDENLPGEGEYRRQEEVVRRLETDSAERAAFQASVGAILASMRSEGFFGDAGLPGDRGFLPELAHRVLQKFLPSPRDDDDLASLLIRAFNNERMVKHFHAIPPALFSRLVALLKPACTGAAQRQGIPVGFVGGFQLLSGRVQAQGLSPKLRRLGTPVDITASPFFRIVRSGDALVEAWQGGKKTVGPLAAWHGDLHACRREMEEIRRSMERAGVSVDVVFGLEVLDRCLSRMDTMARIMTEDDEGRSSGLIHDLLSRLVAFSHSDRSVVHLVRWNLHLLDRKIVERSGETGEHYVAESRKEYRHLWVAAAGGGMLTTFTAALKMAIIGAGFALFWEGFAAGLNYAVSFLLLQTFGLILATKQPAMTAAALADIIRRSTGAEREEEIVEYTAKICRSQLAAALSNVVVVSLGAYVFSLGWELLTARPYLDEAEARYVFESLSPVNSGTVFYAIVTGVILWAASLVGGWAENISVYNRIPAGIIDHRAGAGLGRERTLRLAGSVQHNIAGWATNISLGFMLGFTPAIGHFLGLPLDVRHVTLSTGMLALATAGIDIGLVSKFWLIQGTAGIAVMFVLNLSTSFLLSLFNGAYAYGLTGGEIRHVLGRLARTFLRRPGRFLFPPRK